MSRARAVEPSHGFRPAWQSWLGIVAVVLGILLTAAYGIEWTRQGVIASATPAEGRLPPAECPEDELIEEGLSVAECEQLVSEVRSFIASAPAWFPRVMTAIAAVGTVLAFVSALVGAALLNRRDWAPTAAVAVFGALAAVAAAGFVAAVNTGPILRGEYLGIFLLWFVIYLMMTIGAVVGRAERRAAAAAMATDKDRAAAGSAAMAPSAATRRFEASGGPAEADPEEPAASAVAAEHATAADSHAARGYPRTAVLVHWVLAVSIFFLFGLSWWMLALPLPGEDFRYREFPFQLHKNIGLTLVVLLGLLLYVRRRHRPAPTSALVMPRWMRRLASVDHLVLYVLIFAVCLSGYLSSSYSGWGTRLWWLVDLPYWGYENEELNILYSDIHLWTSWALLAVIAVHISGALYHAFRDDGVVRRMLRL